MFQRGNTLYRVLDNHPMDSRMKIKEDDVFQTMGTRGGQEYEPHTLMVMEETLNEDIGMDNTSDAVVRRLTPLECERLQAFPDHWTDIGEWTDSKGKKHKDADSPRYKALGNSIALPFWQWMANRMTEQLKKDGVSEPTMGSLFSGIGGFELVYTRVGVKPLFSSEVDEYPMAVSKKHFGDEDAGIEGDINQYL